MGLFSLRKKFWNFHLEISVYMEYQKKLKFLNLPTWDFLEKWRKKENGYFCRAKKVGTFQELRKKN